MTILLQLTTPVLGYFILSLILKFLSPFHADSILSSQSVASLLITEYRSKVQLLVCDMTPRSILYYCEFSLLSSSVYPCLPNDIIVINCFRSGRFTCFIASLFKLLGCTTVSWLCHVTISFCLPWTSGIPLTFQMFFQHF